MQLKQIFSLFITKHIFISFADGYLTLSELKTSVKYNASEMPHKTNSERGTETPLNIIVSIEIADIRESDAFERENLLVVDLKVKLTWYDSRLNYTDRDLQNYIYTKDDKAIWTPHLVWITERNANTSIPYTYFRIYPNALVAEFVGVTIKMKHVLSARPSGFSIRLLSLNYTKESLTVEWNDTYPLKIRSDFMDPEHWILSIIDFQARSCYMSVTRLTKRQGGDHSCLEISAEKRIHESMYYASDIGLVIISWACFWMEPSRVIARVAILLACLLHLFTQMTSITQDLFLLKNTKPKSSFLEGCLLFILAACFQTVLIFYLYKTGGTSEATRLSSATTIQEEEGEGIVENSDGEANTLCNHFHFPRIWLDRFPSTPDAINAICRVGFPLGFVIFVCAFFAAHN